MSLSAFLLVIRLVGAVLLILFAAMIAWYLARDLRSARSKALAEDKPYGRLMVRDTDVPDLLVGTHFDLMQSTLIGRSQRCVVVIDEPFVSAEHARLFRRGNRWWVEDLASRNGTLLNDVEVREQTVVTQGDVLTVGSTRLQIELS